MEAESTACIGNSVLLCMQTSKVLQLLLPCYLLQAYLGLQAADATKGAASKADSKTPNPGDIADKAKKSLPFGYMNVGDLAFDLPGSGVSKDDLPNNVKPGDAQGLPKGPTAKPPSVGNPKALDKVRQ